MPKVPLASGCCWTPRAGIRRRSKIKDILIFFVNSLTASSLAPYVRGGWQVGSTLAGLSSGSGRRVGCLKFLILKNFVPLELCAYLSSGFVLSFLF